MTLMGVGLGTCAALTGTLGWLGLSVAAMFVPVLLIPRNRGAHRVSPYIRVRARAVSLWLPLRDRSTANGLITAGALVGIAQLSGIRLADGSARLALGLCRRGTWSSVVWYLLASNQPASSANQQVEDYADNTTRIRMRWTTPTRCRVGSSPTSFAYFVIAAWSCSLSATVPSATSSTCSSTGSVLLHEGTQATALGEPRGRIHHHYGDGRGHGGRRLGLRRGLSPARASLGLSARGIARNGIGGIVLPPWSCRHGPNECCLVLFAVARCHGIVRGDFLDHGPGT